jgi:hypothetical protein
LARRGVGRDRTHGLDACSPAQLELRSLLFYFAFTRGPWHLARMLFYTWDASPQHDMFVMTNVTAPENLARTVGAKGYDRPGLPGLRLLPDAGTGNYDFVHLPTGGRLRVLTGGEGRYGDLAAVGMRPLDDDEAAGLAAAAAMSHHTKRLFAALLARCSCRTMDGRWDVGQFFYASDHEFTDQPGRMAVEERFELTGSGDRWELAWSLATAPETFTRPLITPGIGLPGARITVEQAGTVSTIRLGTAQLRLIRQ